MVRFDGNLSILPFLQLVPFDSTFCRKTRDHTEQRFVEQKQSSNCDRTFQSFRRLAVVPKNSPQ